MAVPNNNSDEIVSSAPPRLSAEGVRRLAVQLDIDLTEVRRTAPLSPRLSSIEARTRVLQAALRGIGDPPGDRSIAALGMLLHHLDEDLVASLPGRKIGACRYTQTGGGIGCLPTTAEQAVSLGGNFQAGVQCDSVAKVLRARRAAVARTLEIEPAAAATAPPSGPFPRLRIEGVRKLSVQLDRDLAAARRAAKPEQQPLVTELRYQVNAIQMALSLMHDPPNELWFLDMKEHFRIVRDILKAILDGLKIGACYYEVEGDRTACIPCTFDQCTELEGQFFENTPCE